MIKIYSTGTPVTASEVLVGDHIVTPNAVVRVTNVLPMPWSGQHRFTGNSVFGREYLVFGSDEIINLADEGSLEDPAVAMSLFRERCNLMAIEERVEKLYIAASEGWLGEFEANGLQLEILGGIVKLRARIDELGGYHNDI